MMILMRMLLIFSYSLIEYKNYLRFKYIIDDIKNLYKEKISIKVYITLKRKKLVN